MTGLQEFKAFKEEILAYADDDGSFIKYFIGIEEYVETLLISSINRSDAAQITANLFSCHFRFTIRTPFLILEIRN